MVGKIDPTPANPGKSKHEIKPHVAARPMPHPVSVAHLYEGGKNPYKHEPVLTSPRAAIDPATGLPANPTRNSEAATPLAAAAPADVVTPPPAETPVETSTAPANEPANDPGVSAETKADAPQGDEGKTSDPAPEAPAAPPVPKPRGKATA